MVDKVSFSEQELSLEAIAFHHENVQAALFEFFSGSSVSLLSRFSLESVEKARDGSLDELDFSSSMSVMAALEAAIRVDYLSRVYERRKDALSRSMRDLYNEKANKAKLDRDILQRWADETPVSASLVQRVASAFRYRHWLAHGRYWTPKFGREYDYDTLYAIADEFIEAMDLYAAST
ncbi:hypothetical protein EGY31_17830 [Burkholderia multivorans]|uniref:hypothetical protein n=1 Tax=Burkholderia ubonensis TaxID=101571 RepID=UPI000F6DF631|nr:hypothetical protein [Burkholderia ubonensis]AYZ65196.1 hypothetical protein EGY31_17830 [Burkholderia multivorans]VWC28247.1 hypothetical protein BUB20358_06215 [Burkholderia ubonensis]